MKPPRAKKKARRKPRLSRSERALRDRFRVGLVILRALGRHGDKWGDASRQQIIRATCIIFPPEPTP